MTSGEPPQRVPLLLWHAWPTPEQQALTKLIDHYNQLHSTVQIIPQAMPLATLTSELRRATLAGNGPQLILLQSHTLGTLAQEGLLLPLDEQLIPPAKLAELITPTVASAHARDAGGIQHLYGLPLTFDTLVLFYNKTRITTSISDTATLLSQVDRLTDLKAQPMVWGFAYTLSLDKTICYLPAFGGLIFDAQGKLGLGSEGREGTEKWLQWLVDLRQNPRILAVNDSIAVDSALKARRAQLTIDWVHMLASYRALWGNALGIALLPALTSTQRRPQPYVQSDVLSLSTRVKGPRERQEALNFMLYLLSPEAQRAFLKGGKQPTLQSLKLEGDSLELEAARVFRAQAAQGLAMPNSRVANEILRVELERMQHIVLRGLATPADAVTSTEANLRARLGPRIQP